MAHEVVVVGAGIGGLTTAALLAARGVDVCLLERASEVGGCVALARHQGYEFEPGMGLYTDWGPGELHESIFAELPAAPPEAIAVTPAYVVRLPDRVEIEVSGPSERFDSSLRQAFPECAAEAVEFYREVETLGAALRDVWQTRPGELQLTAPARWQRLFRKPRFDQSLISGQGVTIAARLAPTSFRFRRFVETQLQFFAGQAGDQCSFLLAAFALSRLRRPAYTLRGGAASLASRLRAAFEQAGGTLRLDTSALRLVYEGAGRAAGVQLLSGETLTATRAVVSNLTVWDTYGKLIGLDHTTPEARVRIKQLVGRGCYLLYAGAEEEACARLPAERIMAFSDWQRSLPPATGEVGFFINLAPVWDPRAPAGKRAVTITTLTEPEPWFAYQQDPEEAEERDQANLELWWERIHAALPELGGGIEIVETATPLTFYENTRRKLGMVGGPVHLLAHTAIPELSHRTSVPNFFMTGDTALPGGGIPAATRSALLAANEIAPPH